MTADQILASLKKLTATLAPKQLAVLGVSFVAVVGVIAGSAYWISAPTYELLAADLDPESAQAVVAKLKTAKVPYQLDPGGRTIRVPAERVDELRLQFASDGLPSSGRIGFEIFDRSTFGTTDLMEHVNFQRALEGELARTISTLTEVASARVHIVIAKDSLFADRAKPSTASVLLRLKSNRPLAPTTAHAIAGLVASAVDSLRPESVVILDTFGRQLSQNSTETDQPDALQLDHQQQIERDFAAKVTNLLEPVVGTSGVRVNVAARLKADAEDLTEERWDPTTVVRSKQMTSEADGHQGGPGGVAGARANLPAPVPTSAAAGAPPATPPPAAVTSLLAATSSKTSELTTYEVSKLTRHSVSPRGQLARLSVAVIVDDEHTTSKTKTGALQTTSKPRSPEEIQRIHQLVAAAVGLDETRGDQLTVENIAFEAPPDETDAPQTVTQQLKDVLRDNWRTGLKATTVVALALVALFGIVRPLAQRGVTSTLVQRVLPAPAPVETAEARRTIRELEEDMAAQAELPSVPPRRLPALTRHVARLASEEPEQLARIVRGWLAEEEH